MDDSLKKTITEGLSSLSSIFSSDKSNKESLGIDIGSSAIKVVQLKKKNGKAVLETYGVLSLGPYGNTDIGTVTNLKTEDLAKALIDVMKESNVTTKNAVVAIPSLSSLIFTISLPDKVSEDQLSKIIPIEARKYIQERGLTEETLKNWEIGYSSEPREMFESMKKKGFSEKTLMESGIFISGYKDRFFGRLLFPIRNYR
jgi:hypothetical protein